MSGTPLKDWYFEGFESYVTGKWRLRLIGEDSEGKVKQTSAIVEVDSSQALVRTYSGSTYLLVGKSRGSKEGDLKTDIERKLRLCGDWVPVQRQGPL